MAAKEEVIEMSLHIESDQSTVIEACCGDSITNYTNTDDNNGSESFGTQTEKDSDEIDGRSKKYNKKGLKKSCMDQNNSYAASKNVAEGLMDIALLSANANQLRFLITYNHEASTYFASLGLVILSLTLQVVVGIALIFKRRIKRSNEKQYTRANEFLIGGVFMITVVNILLAAFTTTDVNKN